MSSLFETLRGLLDEQEWEYDVEEEDEVAAFGYEGDTTQWEVYVRTLPEEEQIVVYSVAPDVVAPERRAAAAEYVCRANFGLVVGNFELDFDDGLIRFKTGCDLEGLELNRTMLTNLVFANLSAMDDYLPGLLAVINNDKEPAEAIEVVEGPTLPAEDGVDEGDGGAEPEAVVEQSDDAEPEAGE